MSKDKKTIKIGVIADTHDFGSFNESLGRIKQIFLSCDYIVHAGDVIHPQVLSELAKIAPLKVVFGNKKADSLNFPSLPKTIIIRSGRFKVGVTHGLGNKPERVFNWFLGRVGLRKPGMKLYFRRIKRFFPKDIDCIIFGDLHTPMCQKESNKLFLNPGTTDKKEDFKGSVGIIEVKENGLFPKIIYF